MMSTPGSRVSLMTLPTEIRLRIYTYLLGTINFEAVVEGKLTSCTLCGMTHPLNRATRSQVMDPIATQSKAYFVTLSKQVYEESHLLLQNAINRLKVESSAGVWREWDLACQTQALSQLQVRVPTGSIKPLKIDHRITPIHWSNFPQLESIVYKTISCAMERMPSLYALRVGQAVADPYFAGDVKGLQIQSEFLQRFVAVVPSSTFDKLPTLRSVTLSAYAGAFQPEFSDKMTVIGVVSFPLSPWIWLTTYSLRKAR